MSREKKFDKVEYNNKYNGDKYDRVSLMLPKGQRELLRLIATQRGYKGINGLINSLIKKELDESGINWQAENTNNGEVIVSPDKVGGE